MEQSRLPPADLVSRTVETLSQRILVGQFEAEARLPSQGELCIELGVSRSVMREAMRILQSRGFIDISQGARPRVMPARREVVIESFGTFLKRAGVSLTQVLEMRGPLEAEIATLAARHITPAQIEELQRSVDALAGAADFEAQIEADVWFHRILAEASGNPLFGIILDVLAEQLRASRRRTLARSGVEIALGYHQRVCAAVAAHDTEAARREMISHMDQTRRDLENGDAVEK